MGRRTLTARSVVTVTHDGAPSAEFFDRIYVNGPNVGAATW